MPELQKLLVALRPRLDEPTVLAAFAAQQRALQARHKAEQDQAFAQGLSAYALEKARAIIVDILNANPTPLVDEPPPLFSGLVPPSLALQAGEVERLRNLLPGEACVAINETHIAVESKLPLAQEFEKRLVAYRDDFDKNAAGAVKGSMPWMFLGQRQRGEAWDLEERHKLTIELFKARATKTTSPPTTGGQQVAFVIPDSTPNTATQQRRYFRFLAWNLENFTRDRRPRGSAPVDALRNQARIAAVADAAARFYADAVLIMETGTDVGPATTALARRLEEKCKLLHKDDRPWHPLTSPCTGSMPAVDNEYRINVGRPSMAKALALQLLSEVYEVRPDTDQSPADVTGEQISYAWQILRLISPAFRAAAAVSDPPHPEKAVSQVQGKGVAAHELIGFVTEKIAETAAALSLSKEEEVDIAPRLEDLYAFCFLLQSEIVDGTFSSVSGEDMIDIVERARELSDCIPESGAALEGWVQALELLFLFTIQGVGDKDSEVLRSSVDEICSYSLTAFLTTGAQHVKLEVLDRKLGPLQQDVDADLVIDALVKLGAIERHVETYGIVYREPYPDALDHLFEIGVREDALGVKLHGFVGGGLDEEAASYRIVQGQLSRASFSIQEPRGLLNWRSALQITLPVAPKLFAPVVLYHTRYSGTAEIAKMDPRFTSEENAVLARCESVRLMTEGVQPGAPAWGPPLVVGDFNLPNEYVNGAPQPTTTKAALASWERKEAIRTELLKKMMAMGYVRHIAQDGTCPKTTLKAFGSIALGEDYPSQPYDGVYEPCGYVRAQVDVASGVLLPEGLITADLLKEEIEGHAPGNANADFDPDKDDDDGNDDGSGQAQDVDTTGIMDAEPPPPPKKQTTVAESFGTEIGRVYRSFFRKFERDLTAIRPWMARAKQPKTSTRKSTYKSQGPSPKLVETIEKLEAFPDAAIAVLVDKRVEWFIELVKADGAESYAIKFVPDNFADLHALVKGAADAAKDQGDTSLTKLVETLERTLMQALRLETDRNARYLIGYRAVVSDHLPQIIEIDTQPV